MIASLSAAVLLTAAAISAPAQPAAFDVASIKPNPSGETYYGIRIVPGGNLRAVNASLEALIAEAWRIPDFELAGAPGWAKSERWDIDAKSSRAPAPDRVLQMLRLLLADRFQLKVHTESRQLPAYAIVIAKNGPKLEPSREACFDPTAGIPPPAPTARPCGGFNRSPAQLLGARVGMTELARVLAKTLGRPVVDQTGIQGSYDIVLNWRPDELQPDAPANNLESSIFTALEQQLGLRLESRRAPVDVLVIDSAERASAN